MSCLNDECEFVQAKFGEEKDYETSLRRLRGEDADIFQEATEIRVNFELFLIRKAQISNF